eukprot:673399-Pyramimonas_sp.AAC.1
MSESSPSGAHRHKQLRRHPEGRAEVPVGLFLHREPKVGELGVEGGAHQHVGRLEVIMQHRGREATREDQPPVQTRQWGPRAGPGLDAGTY